MGNVKGFAVILGLKLALLAGAATVAHAEGQPPQEEEVSGTSGAGGSVRHFSVSDLVIPPELGYITETHPPTTSTSGPLVIHIQEAHANPEARRHIAEMLARLVEQEGLRLILVEGGEGDVGLSSLRALGSAEARKETAERYLNLGLLSGEEYLDLVSDRSLTLWGIEDQALYQRHIETFLTTEPVREAAAPVVASLRKAVDALQSRLYPADLKELEAKAHAFAEEQLALAEYADYLVRTARRQAVPEAAYPHLLRVLELHRLEQELDPAQVHREQVALVTQLGPRVAPEQLEDLTTMARQMNEHPALREEFYTRLERLAADAGLSLDPYPQLVRYLTYLQQHRRLEVSALMQELDELVMRLRRTLADTPECRRLQAIAEQTDLLEKLMALQLSPPDYERIKTSSLPGALSDWTDVLNPEQISQLATAVPVLRKFYEVAAARDDALATHALAKLAESRERVIVVITGGFHSPSLTRRLTERGFGVVVVTPNVSQPTNDQVYRAALKYKHGRGSLSEVLRLSQPAGSSTSTR